MIKIILISIFVVCFSAPFLRAQNTDPLAPWMDLVQDDPAIAEILNELLQNPIPINTASFSEWQRIPLLTDEMIRKILKSRKEKGKFASVRQIRTLVGNETYRRIRPFLVLTKATSQKLSWTQRNYRYIDLPDPQKVKQYQGSNLYNLTRLTFHPDQRFSAGLVLQKDIGEPSLADYLNGFVRYQSPNVTMILGGYYVQIGQGLIFSSPFGRMKSAMVFLPVISRRDGVYSYIGSAENSTATGCVFQIKKGKNFFRALWGRTLRDAHYNPNTLNITDFSYTGYHRTAKELREKDILLENMWAVNVVHHWGENLRTGLIWSNVRYEPGICFDPANIAFHEWKKRFFHFSGRKIGLLSVYYHWQNSRFLLSGEAATSNFKANAFSQSLLVKTAPFSFGLLAWHVANRFYSPYGRVFDNANPFPQSEQGLYAAAEWNGRNGSTKFYKLLKRKLWRDYWDPFPKTTDEWLSQTEWKFHQHRVIVRLRGRSYQRYEKQTASQSTLVEPRKTNIRLEWQTSVKKGLRLKNRVEYVMLSYPHEKGLLIFQDIAFKFNKSINVNTRFSVFRTHSFNTAVYEYESDVPGSFSNYAFYGQGYKWYLKVGLKLGYYFRLWIKYRYLMFNKRNFYFVDYGHVSQPLQRLLRLQFQVVL